MRVVLSGCVNVPGFVGFFVFVVLYLEARFSESLHFALTVLNSHKKNRMVM